MTFAALVVTFNRKELLKKNLAALMQQTHLPDKIVIIDNYSTDGTEAWLREQGYFQHPLIQYIQLSENTGSSGGFYEGIKTAYEAGYDWIWGMNDDAIPEKQALEYLVQEAKIDPDACYFSNNNNDEIGYYHDLKIVHDWTFVGFFISKQAIQIAGYPRKDFFIYYDDLEYALRIQKHDRLIKKVRTSIIHHDDRKVPQTDKGYGFFGLTGWRLYYEVRNRILLHRYTGLKEFARVGKNFLEGFILIPSPNRYHIFLKAFLHGIISKSGKQMDPSSSNK
jgi:rhamnopyranosyl-N-acetylglucosaminyl-diphospho-decaprenol beta-1,3/1,4-galactofuranosyltransferase